MPSINLQNIQIGLDLATSVSVCLATLGFIYTNIKENKSRIDNTREQQRREHISKIIHEFVKILRDGANLIDKVNDERSSNTITVSCNDLLSICQRMVLYINIDADIAFSIWATKQEQEQLQEIREIAINYRNALVASINDGSHAPSFNDFLDKIKGLIKEFTIFAIKDTFYTTEGGTDRHP